jgi:hypothetical protein
MALPLDINRKWEEHILSLPDRLSLQPIDYRVPGRDWLEQRRTVSDSEVQWLG